MPWGLVFDEDTLELAECTAGSVAFANARAQACVGKVLTKVNGKHVNVSDWEGLASSIEEVDAIGLHFRHSSISVLDERPQGPVPLLAERAIERGEQGLWF
eukprot:gene4976-biopygen1055